MAFDIPIAFDADKNEIRWCARCTAADTIRLEVDTNSGFTSPIAGGDVTADAALDFTAKGSVGGLQPNTTYYHRFVVNSSVVSYDVNPIGGGGGPPFLKTAPADDFSGTVKIAFGSCQLDGNGVIWQAMDGEGADLFLQLGDRTYIDEQVQNPPDALDDYWTGYKLTHRNTPDLEARFTRYILLRRAMKNIMDDHEHGLGDIDLASTNFSTLRGWAVTAFKAYSAVPTLPRSDAIYRTERWGNIELFFLDNRLAKQDPAAYARWPFDGADNHTIEASSTRTQIVLKDGGTGHVADKTLDAYAGWYMKLSDQNLARTVVRPPNSDMWRRVTGSQQTAADEVTLTLEEALPLTFDPAVNQHLFMEQASVLDGGTPFQTGNQWGWLVDALRASTAKVKLIVSSQIANNTQVAGDNWRSYSAQNGEIRTLYQMVKNVLNVFWLSGDMHRHGQDDGSNGEFPEISASPMDKNGLDGAVATWSHGQAQRPTNNPDGTANGWATLEISDTQLVAKQWWSNNGTSGDPMDGITTMTIALQDPTPPPDWRVTKSDGPERADVQNGMVLARSIGAAPTGEDLTPEEAGAALMVLVGGRVRYNATVTAGDRQLRVEVLEDFGSGDVVVEGHDLSTIAENGETTLEIEALLPAPVYVGARQKLRVLDKNAVDATDDVDLYLRLLTY